MVEDVLGVYWFLMFVLLALAALLPANTPEKAEELLPAEQQSLKDVFYKRLTIYLVSFIVYFTCIGMLESLNFLLTELPVLSAAPYIIVLLSIRDNQAHHRQAASAFLIAVLVASLVTFAGRLHFLPESINDFFFWPGIIMPYVAITVLMVSAVAFRSTFLSRRKAAYLLYMIFALCFVVLLNQNQQ